MGKNPRLRQKGLPKKLLRIRSLLGLSQTEMLKTLGFDGVIDYKRLSEYELGKNEPPLRILLAYARLAGVSMETLADDDRQLPRRFLAPLPIGKRKKKRAGD